MGIYTQEQINFFKKRYRTNDDSAFKIARVKKNNEWLYIKEPYLYSVDIKGEFNSISRATLTIVDKNNKFNFRLQDNEWNGVLDKQWTKIEIFEGYPVCFSRTFVGYIQKVEVSLDYENGKIITVTCLSQVAKLSEVNSTEVKYPVTESDIFNEESYLNDGVNYNDVLSNLFNDLNSQLQDRNYDPINYEIGEGITENYIEENNVLKWKKAFNIITEYDTESYIEGNENKNRVGYYSRPFNIIAVAEDLNKLFVSIQDEIERHKFKILEIDFNNNIIKEPNFGSKRFVHPAIVYNKGKVMLFGSLTRSSTPLYSGIPPTLEGYAITIKNKIYTDKIIVKDFYEEEEYKYNCKNKLPKEIREDRIGTYNIGVDGNIYVLSLEDNLIKIELNHEKKEATFKHIGNIKDDLGIYIKQGNYTKEFMYFGWFGYPQWINAGNSDMRPVYGNIFMITKDVITIIYQNPNNNILTVKDIDISDGELKEIQTIEIDYMLNDSKIYLNTFYYGYFFTFLKYNDYIVSNILNKNAVYINTEKVSGIPCMFKNKFFIIPNKVTEEDVGTVYYMDANVKPPKDTEEIFEYAPYYDIQNQKALYTVNDILDDSGMKLVEDFFSGQTFNFNDDINYSNIEDSIENESLQDEKMYIYYPNIEAEEEYVFTSEDIISLTMSTNDEDYGVIQVQYGTGDNSGTVSVGDSGKILRLNRPRLSRQQALNLIDKILTFQMPIIVEIECRGIPNLIHGKTVKIIDNNTVGELKGVCTKFSSTNQEGAYVMRWTIIGY